MNDEEPDGTEAIAQRLREALEGEDLDALAELLDPDVRWGGEEDTEQTCHNRAEALARYSGLHARGVRATLAEVAVVRPDAIVVGFDVRDSRGSGDARRVSQTFTVSGGLVVDIRPGG